MKELWELFQIVAVIYLALKIVFRKKRRGIIFKTRQIIERRIHKRLDRILAEETAGNVVLFKRRKKGRA